MKRAALLYSLAVAIWIPCARADDKSECVAAYSDAQDLRLAGKLSAAHERLRVCARPVCPAFIAHDCASWMGEIEASAPSLVLGAKDAAGRDLTNVRVSLDGIEIKQSLDGQAMTLDPGPHTLVFTRDGGAPITEDVVIRIGEKNRRLVVTFGSPAEPVIAPLPTAPLIAPPIAPAPSAPVLLEPQTSSRVSHGRRTAGYIVGAAGVVGLLGGATVGIVALATKSARCGRDNVCESNTLGLLGTEATISTTGLIAGTALLAGGVALVLVGGKPERAALWIAPFATGRGVDVTGRF